MPNMKIIVPLAAASAAVASSVVVKKRKGSQSTIDKKAKKGKKGKKGKKNGGGRRWLGLRRCSE